MNEVILYAVGSLGALAIVAAIILYFVAQKFKVFEDPRIDDVDEILPSANCGGCGYAGCRAFAEAIVKAGNMEGFKCPVGGSDVMVEVGKALGLEAEITEPQIAVVRCNGTVSNSPAKVKYDGISSCAAAATLYSGEGGCSFGCLGLGDCEESCEFDAIHVNPETMIPEVTNNCVACNACIIACPKDIIELRNVGKKERRIFVSCINEEKGAPAKKNCSVACIGCSKCFKVCPFDAIEMKNNRAYIDYEKCKLCRKCVTVCPTDAIHEINFPLKKLKPTTDAKKESPKKVEATEKIDLTANLEVKASSKPKETVQARTETVTPEKTAEAPKIKLDAEAHNKEDKA
ncbi:MAG: RnfABCDGE type electron transport complex subunit B [Bacteroidales bacterium]|nr:RnfABCDGE type electron transport complex subunit B [Bacteroidales bacterium]